jgi:hypothetical protein
MEIGSYKPRSGFKSFNRERVDGSGKAEIYTDFGVVNFFTFPGTNGPPEHRAFTSLDMYLAGRVFYATIPGRFYSTRWWRRLANEFAFECYQSIEEEMLHGKALS